MADIEYLSVTQYARRMNVNHNTVYKAVQKGTLPHVKLGGLIRIPWPPETTKLRPANEEVSHVSEN